MKMPHLLRVDDRLEIFDPLISEAAERGLRVGWLDLGEDLDLAGSLEFAASSQLLRAVVAGPKSTVVVKPRRGRPVLRDLLREHFRGASLVLVRGEIEATRLQSDGGAWRLLPAAASEVRWTTQELAAALRRPRLAGVEAGN